MNVVPHKIIKNKTSTFFHSLRKPIDGEIGIKEHTVSVAKSNNHEFIITQQTKDNYYRFGSFTTIDAYISEFGDINTHSFEIINGDCKLYFDVEYFGKTEEFINNIINSIKKHAKDFFGVEILDNELFLSQAHGIGEKGAFKDIMKWSTHIVVNNGLFFKHNRDIKNFIKYIESVETDEDIISSIDKLVYNNNQDFKMPNQSKFGSTRVSKIVNGAFIDHLVNLYTHNTHKEYYVFKEQTQSIITRRINKKKKIEIAEQTLRVGTVFPDQVFDEPIDPLDIHRLLEIFGNEDYAYDVFWEIRCIVKNEGHSIETFINWAKKSSKYLEDETLKTWEGNASLSKDGFNLSNLRRLVRIKYPNAFREPQHLFIDSITKPTINLEQHGYDCLKYRQRYMRPITEHIFKKKDSLFDTQKLYDTLVIKSHLGTGKTTVMENIIRENVYQSCVIFSPRVVFAHKMLADFKGIDPRFELYKDIPKEKRHMSKFIVCQLESLATLGDHFDVIIFDESESLIAQLGSSTMENSIGQVSRRMETMFKTAKLVVCGDAFVTDRTLCIINKLRPKKSKKLYIENDFQPYKRKAYHVAKTGTGLCDFFKKFVKNNPNDRNVISTGSRDNSEKLRDISMDENMKTLVINKYTDDEIINQMRDVNSLWSKYQNVIYTSSVTVGVSYDCDKLFDNLFLHFSVNSCNPRDTCQSSLRARYIKNNVLYYSTNSVRFNNLTPNMFRFDELKKWKLSTMSADVETDDWLIDAWVYNNMENNISAHFHKNLVERYLSICGYTLCDAVDTVFKDELNIENIKSLDVDFDINDLCYDNIDDLETSDDVTDNKNKMLEGRASTADKLQYEKQQFKDVCFLRETEVDHEIMSSMWDEYIKNAPSIINKIKNIRYECQPETNDVCMYFQNREHMKKYMVEMTNVLEIKNTFDFSIIKRSKMNDIRKWFIENNKWTHSVFNLDTKRYSKDSKYDTDKSLSGFVSHLFGRWSGMELQIGERKRKMVNGVRVDNGDFQIVPQPIMNNFIENVRKIVENDKKLLDNKISNERFEFANDYDDIC